MTYQRCLVLLLLAGSLVGMLLATHAGDRGPHAEASAQPATDPVRSLSPKLQGLLKREMLLIGDGMATLLDAISSGEWEAAGETAEKLQHSFILEQQLDANDAEELHGKLPAAFLRMDVHFHETAGRMARAAEARDAELVSFYYFRLVEGCVGCHAAFAPQRFPGLARRGPAKTGGHQH